MKNKMNQTLLSMDKMKILESRCIVDYDERYFSQNFQLSIYEMMCLLPACFTCTYGNKSVLYSLYIYKTAFDKMAIKYSTSQDDVADKVIVCLVEDPKTEFTFCDCLYNMIIWLDDNNFLKK